MAAIIGNFDMNRTSKRTEKCLKPRPFNKYEENKRDQQDDLCNYWKNLDTI